MITEPCKISDRITYLGRFESCVYVVDGGKESVLIGGGMSYIIPDMLRQMKDFGLDERKIKRLIILHAHFDHCGIIPFFKKRWPWTKVVASERAKQVLSDPKITRVFANLNWNAITDAGITEQAEQEGFAFSGVEIDETVKEGDVIPCGELTLEFLETPGHSSCSSSIYIPREKALFTSDSAGICYEGKFQATANSNYDLYQQSLEKLAAYDARAVLPEHFGAAKGEEARIFLKNSIKAAKRERAMLEESYRRTRDKEKSTEEITDILVKETPAPFIPRKVRATVVGQMLNFLAPRIEEQDKMIIGGKR